MSLDLEEIRSKLESTERELSRELDSLTAVPRDPVATIGFGKRVGDGTTEAIGRIERIGQAGTLAAKLVDVGRALAKLEEGTYGICDRCGTRIPDDRLGARPASVRCMRCSASNP
ncbi:MAG: TraR/DksA family transcriptional regulator [Actinomycetota bacterium]